MSNISVSIEVGECNCVEKVRSESARRGRGIDELLRRVCKEIKEGGGWPSDRGKEGSNALPELQ